MTAGNVCEPIPDLTGIECYPDHMVAYFSAADFTNADMLSLMDDTCDEASFHIVHMNDRYRVEVKLDECGTVATYDAAFQTITFTNAITSDIDIKKKINMMTRMNQEFSCVYSANINIGDLSVNATSEAASYQGENTGEFSFKLDLWTSDTFAEPANGPHRVGELLYYSITQEPAISNTVFRTTNCAVLSADRTLDFEIFDGDNFQTFVDMLRWKPLYFDDSGETCAAASKDRFSYKVFEFVGVNGTPAPVNSTVHIECDIQVCVAEDDMTNSPCNDPCNNAWGVPVIP